MPELRLAMLPQVALLSQQTAPVEAMPLLQAELSVHAQLQS